MGVRFLYCIAVFFFLGQSLEAPAQSEPLSEDSAAKPLFQPSLEYPQSALDAGQEGACIVNFYVSSTGKPQSVSATCSDPVFTHEAVSMVNGSMYTPRMMDGQAVLSSKIVLPVNFSLEKHSLAHQQESASVTQSQSDKLTSNGIEQTVISDESQKPNLASSNQKIETKNNIETERMSEQIDEISTELDIMHCAKQAQELAKSGGMFGGLGKIAKFAGYDDIAKGMDYYDKANRAIDKLNKKEKKIYNDCIQERETLRDIRKRTSENLKKQEQIKAEAERKYELALAAPHKSNQDAFPVIRIPPKLPIKFIAGDHSGYCKVRFDLNEKGIPFNVKTTVCTSPILSESTLSSVSAWRYSPKYENGKTVIRSNVESTVRFDLQDETGRKLPLPEGY